MLILTAGTIFVMWLGEKITDKGIGNGISLIIMIGIIARLPFAFGAEFASRIEGGGGLIIITCRNGRLFISNCLKYFTCSRDTQNSGSVC